MEDIGSLVYYILIFAVVIISWVNSSAKKKQQQRASIPSPFPTQEMPAVPPPVPGKKKQRLSPVPKKNRQESNQSSFISSKYMEKAPVFLEEDCTTIAEELDLNNADSYRKAFIYSEILNRKEW